MRETKGITLVALVITIIIIIILATVTINMAFGDNGLIKQAELARDLTANSMGYETQATSNLIAYMNEMLEGSGITLPVTNEIGGTDPEPEPEPPKVEEIKGGEAFTEKTTVEDSEGNKIVVPAGFKIAADSGDTVQQGIVIEDVSASADTNVQGSQFVWIPVGVFIKDGGTPSNEIILGRYTFADVTGVHSLIQSGEDYMNQSDQIVISRNYKELISFREGSSDTGENATAKELNNFINSANTNGGYYIGRYEASFASGASIADYKAASKISTNNSASGMAYEAGTLWNRITQLDASKVAINTYKDSSSVKSDLMNSYAWDTAIMYIQEANNNSYSKQTSKNTNLSNTGECGDEACKINDMASNLLEWTTEYSSYAIGTVFYHCTSRGGRYNGSNQADTRVSSNSMENFEYLGFRIILYI